MASGVLCETSHLYNILNQRVRVPRVAECNYLSLIGENSAEHDVQMSPGLESVGLCVSGSNEIHVGVTF